MINVDTKKIDQCGNNIIKLSQDLNIIIQELYAKINKIAVTNTWIGNSATSFISKANIEKIRLLEYQKNLYNYGVILKQNAQKYDEGINKISM